MLEEGTQPADPNATTAITDDELIGLILCLECGDNEDGEEAFGGHVFKVRGGRPTEVPPEVNYRGKVFRLLFTVSFTARRTGFKYQWAPLHTLLTAH